nr:hypothetical protein [Tanacetum cinerariifolium]
MDETTVRLWLKDHQDAAEKLARQQAKAFQLQLDTLRAELQATRGLFQNRHGGGGDQLLPRSMRLDVLMFSGDDPERLIFAITKSAKALSKLLQLGAVEDYQQEFEKLTNRVTDIQESLLISFYISGLKLNLQHELLVSRPTTLSDAFSLARVIEARFEATAKKKKEHIVRKKTYDILPLQSELASPKIKGSLNADEDIGVDEKSVEEVVGGGEAFGVGEDDDSGNAATDGGDDAVESGGISILNSLIGHGSPRSSQLLGTIRTTDVQVLIDKGVDKEFQCYVYTLHVLILFLNSLNGNDIKKKKMEAAIQRRLCDLRIKIIF